MRPVVELIRLENDEQYGIFGVLKVQKRVFCVTLEPLDKLNQKDKACIPAQQYICRRCPGPGLQDIFQVVDVPGSDNIFLHSGNSGVPHGGILLGQYFGKLKAETGRRAILNSGNTLKEFLGLMINCDEFHLTISESY